MYIQLRLQVLLSYWAHISANVQVQYFHPSFESRDHSDKTDPKKIQAGFDRTDISDGVI